MVAGGNAPRKGRRKPSAGAEAQALRVSSGQTPCAGPPRLRAHHPEPPASRHGAPPRRPMVTPHPGVLTFWAVALGQRRPTQPRHSRARWRQDTPLPEAAPAASPDVPQAPAGRPLRQGAAKLSPSGKLRRSAFGPSPLTEEPPCGVQQAPGGAEGAAENERGRP